MEKLCAPLLILLSVPAGHCDSHSLRYYYNGVSVSGSGLPVFFKFGYVDDKNTWLYRSDTGRAVPVAAWMEQIPEYWESETKISQEEEALYRREVKMVINRLNHTEGFHYVQVMIGCELRDDGSTVGYSQYRYDGREYMHFDTQTAVFIATMAEAQLTAQRWNQPDLRMRGSTMHYLENECIENLKAYIELGREDLERRVRPGVKVTGRKSGEVTKLHCQVYGFHPRAVDVKWMKNGVDEIPYEESTHVLPNPDGTYQIRVTVEVTPQEGDSYSCYVDHSSLEEPLLVKWEPKQDLPLWVIISVGVISALLLISVIAGVVICKKKKDKYTAAGASDPSFDSDPPVNA